MYTYDSDCVNIAHYIYDSSAMIPEESSTEVVGIVTGTLSFLLLLEHTHPEVLKSLAVGSKLARLMCIFLIGLFLSTTVLVYSVCILYITSLMIVIYYKQRMRMTLKSAGLIDTYMY